MTVLRPLLAAMLLLGACATKPPASDVEATADYNEANDPLEPTNRFFYKVNDGLDTYVLRPVAVFYRKNVPSAVRRPIHNVLNNLGHPVQFANDVMEAKPRKAGDTLMRFAINSTVGLGGAFDVATDWGYPDHSNDFGLTLATWGVGAGPFLYLPVLGPSNPRDGIGFGVNGFLDPLSFGLGFGGRQTIGTVRFVAGAVDTRERLLDQIDQIQKGALDPYATFRSLYRQNRLDEIAKAKQDRPATVPAWFK